jgi:hypothetical protein
LHIITKADVNVEGGKQNLWLPTNNFEKRYLKIWGVK